MGGPQSPTFFSRGQKIDYRYPRGLDLDPNSELHKKIITEVWMHCNDSSMQMSKRYPYWKKVDQTLTAYIRPDDAERLVKLNDDRKPISIVVPYSYATLETLLTYFVAAFLENPYFRYEGVSPEDIKGAALMQLIVDMHCMRNKVGLALHTMFRDSLSYGFGVVAPKWTKEYGSKIVLQDRVAPFFSKFMDLGKQRVMQPATLFEGNELWNIDPYLYLPDPNVPIHLPQRGEFVGWIEMSNYLSLLTLEKNDSEMFNVQYLSQLIGGSGVSIFNKAKSSTGRDTKTGGSSLVVGSTTRPVDVIWQYINLIPAEWGLSRNSSPEKWLFGVAADKIVVCAKPLGLAHNKFPVAVCAPDYDGYSVTPISRMEITYGLQETLDWLFNSHITNVRKAINDMLIYDPSLVNANDLKDPAPGKLIRMRRAAWGRGVDKAVAQLNVQDVTRGHITDAGYIVDLFQRISAATDSLSGIARKEGERVSAKEAGNVYQSSLSRLTKAAKIASLQAMGDIGYFFANHTQQLMTQDVYVKQVGQWPDVLAQEYPNANRIKATPYDLVIEYDLMIKDGSIVHGGESDLWTQMFQTVAQNPALWGQLDIVKIFTHIARKLGAKDVYEFIKQAPPVQAQVTSPEAIDKQVQQGNLVPTAVASGGAA
jgi:hypothetical protein